MHPGVLHSVSKKERERAGLRRRVWVNGSNARSGLGEGGEREAYPMHVLSVGSYHVHLGMCILFIYWIVITCFKGILGHFFLMEAVIQCRINLRQSITFYVL